MGRLSQNNLAPHLGLGLVLASVLLVRSEAVWAGWGAIAPVCGAGLLIATANTQTGWPGALLGHPVTAWIGRLSYSLYLWHWPAFSLIDYGLFLQPEGVRLSLKLALSILLAVASYYFIETPARRALSRPIGRRYAFGGLAITLLVCVPLGLHVRHENYINNDSAADVRTGGLMFPGKPSAPTVVLMGDSNASMYGKMLKELCAELGYNLVVLSVAAGDELPDDKASEHGLWNDALSAVEKIRPDVLVMANEWTGKLADRPVRLQTAIEQLSPRVKKSC
jgi:hypothetical protein